MRVISGVLVFCVLALLLGGCAPPVQDAAELPMPEGFSLPQKTIYALGEATHGSAEFTLARQNIFAYLVKERGVRAFCLEADFGEGQKINGLLHAESWNAAQATRQFSFWVYKHQEMANLMQWMRDYNSTAAPGEQVRFYGIDCQQWEDGKARLHAYLQNCTPELAQLLEQPPLANIQDGRKEAPEVLAAAIAEVEALLLNMEDAREEFLKKSEEREYDIALQTARSLRLCLLLQQAGPENGDLFRDDLSKEEAMRVMEQSKTVSGMRDAGMAAHVDWVLAHEKKYYGRDAVFLTGHNGHITKENGNAEVAQLGELLAAQYGGAYYAIGTDFGRGWFKAVNLGGRGMKVFLLEDGPLATYFKGEAPVTFVAFDGVEGAEAAFFKGPQRMHTIGSIFSKDMQDFPDSYLIERVPAECYDALLYFEEVHAFHSF